MKLKSFTGRKEESGYADLFSGQRMLKTISYNINQTNVKFVERHKQYLGCGLLCCYLVSTYVVCERLSVMYEPAGVVEILVQILQFTPIL